MTLEIDQGRGGEYFYSLIEGALLAPDWILGLGSDWERSITKGIEDSIGSNTLTRLKAYQQRQPFAVDTFTYGGIGVTGLARSLYLVQNEIVFISSVIGLHQQENRNNIKELLNCMDVAKNEGDAVPNWPKIHYAPSAWGTSTEVTHNHHRCECIPSTISDQ